MTAIPFGPIKIDLLEYASRANGILGIRDSGKTGTATYFAERIHHGGVPFIAFDPSGAWKSLRYPGKGPGLPVVIAGQGGDLPLNPNSVAAMIEAAMKAGVSLVVDLSGHEFSKADWRRIVKASVNTLLHKNFAYGLRHVFIEEAAEFVPQRPSDGETYAVVEKLIRIGGNSRLGATLINQRAAEVAKSVLELCDNLFLHRQRGKNSIESLDKWLDIAEVEGAKGIIASLSSLPTGECWAWLGQDLKAHRVKVPMKDSAFPDRRVLRGDITVGKGKAADVGSFVDAMRGSLGKIEEEAKANDPAALRKRIAELEKGAKAPTVDQAAVDQAYRDGYKTGQDHAGGAMRNFIADLRESMRTVAGSIQDIEAATNDIDDAAKKAEAATGSAPTNSRTDKKDIAVAKARLTEIDANPESLVHGQALARRLAAMSTTPPKKNDGIDRPLQKIIDAIRWWNGAGIAEPNAPQVAFLAGYSHRSSTWSTYCSRLRSVGLIEVRGLKLTAAGYVASNDPDNGPDQIRDTGAFREKVLTKLDGPLVRIMRPIIAAYPDELTTLAASESAGYSSASSTWSTYLSRLRSLDLIGKRGLKASEWLFP